MQKVYWCVDDEAKALPTIEGTSDEENGSEFYLEDKGKGKFYLYFYKGNEKKESSKRRLAIKRSELPNTQIIVAVAKCEYSNRRNLKFETKNRYSEGIITVSDWLRKEESVYLRVRSAERFRPKKFYIKMNHVQSTEYDISFVSADSGTLSDQTLFFICEEVDTSSFTSRGELLGTGNTLSSSNTNEPASSSGIADSDPLSSRTQSDNSPVYLEEIPDDPRFDALVSEDYIFPDLDMFEDECIQN